MYPPGFPRRYRLTGDDPENGGGQGGIYRAEDRRTKQRVALKLALPGHAADIWREAQALAPLHHPAILPLLDLGRTTDRMPFLVLPWADGGNLEDWRQSGTPSQARLPDILEQIDRVLAALAHAHARDVLHRDIKAANILLDGDGRWFLADFGVAKSRTRLEQAKTESDHRGTRGNQPPELRLPRPELPSAVGDLFMLGLLLLDLFAGSGKCLGLGLGHAPIDFALVLCAERPRDRPPSAGAARRLLREMMPADAPTGGPWRSRRGLANAEFPCFAPPVRPTTAPARRELTPFVVPRLRGRQADLGALWIHARESAERPVVAEITGTPREGTSRVVAELLAELEERSGVRPAVLDVGPEVGAVELLRRAGLSTPSEAATGAVRGDALVIVHLLEHFGRDRFAAWAAEPAPKSSRRNHAPPWGPGSGAPVAPRRPGVWLLVHVRELVGTREAGATTSKSGGMGAGGERVGLDARRLVDGLVSSMTDVGMPGLIVLEWPTPPRAEAKSTTRRHTVLPLESDDRIEVLADIVGREAAAAWFADPQHTLAAGVANSRLSGFLELGSSDSPLHLSRRAVEAFLDIDGQRRLRGLVLGSVLVRLDQPSERELLGWLGAAQSVASAAARSVLEGALEYGILRGLGDRYTVEPSFQEAVIDVLARTPDVDGARRGWAADLLARCSASPGLAAQAHSRAPMLGSPETSAELLLLEAEYENRRGGSPARERLERALESLSGLPDVHDLVGRVRLAMLEALRFQGNLDKIALWVDYLEPYEDAVLERRRLEAAAQVSLDRGDGVKAQAFAEAAARLAGPGTCAEARLLLLVPQAMRTRVLAEEVSMAELLSAHDLALEAAQSLPQTPESQQVLALAWFRRGESRSNYGRQHAEALRDVDRALAIQETLDNEPIRSMLLGRRGILLCKTSTNWEEGVALARRAHQRLIACLAHGEAAAVMNNLGDEIKGRDPVAAIDALQTAAKDARRSHTPKVGQAARLELALLAEAATDPKGCADQLAQLQEEWPDQPMPDDYQNIFDRLAAWCR